MITGPAQKLLNSRQGFPKFLSDKTGDPGDVPTDSVNTTVRDQRVGRKLHPGHTCSVTSSTPFGALVIQRGAMETSQALPARAAACWLGTAGQSVFTEISAWPFPSIVSCPSDLLKQCVSYRFCLPAWASLFYSSKQTVSIYRSMHLTKRNLEA